MSETLDIGARKELLQEPAPPPPAARRPRQTLLWTIIGIFLAAQGIWAIHAGLALRATIWPNTRSVRFQSDMMTLFFLGNGALREAEAQAKLPNLSDVMTGQPPVTVLELHLQNGAGFGAVRHLTVGEVVTGIVHFYDRSLASGMDPFGNQYFGLDYPPLRLAIATFFVRHVQMTHPDLEYFPARRSGREDTVVPKIEDIMQPMLHFNTACELAAALAIFPLVWLWVRRGAGKGLNAPVPRYPGGLAAFMLATAGFWYCYVGLSALPPRATPIVDLIRVVSNDKNASVLGTVDGGRRPAQWRVEWGTSPVYSNFTPLRMVPGIRQMHVLATLSPLTKGETIHFRLMANDAGGTSFTPDEVFTVGGPTVQFDPDPAGGIAWPGWFVWMSMLALFITMVVSARWLPPRHRAWACGLVASLLVWFDPITILDAHAWPQWDVWILPVFILAALLASMEWWICAGIILGVGCMMKGQILLGGPILLLWPIFAGKWGAAGRILTGFAAGALAVADLYGFFAPVDRLVSDRNRFVWGRAADVPKDSAGAEGASSAICRGAGNSDRQRADLHLLHWRSADSRGDGSRDCSSHARAALAWEGTIDQILDAGGRKRRSLAGRDAAWRRFRVVETWIRLWNAKARRDADGTGEFREFSVAAAATIQLGFAPDRRHAGDRLDVSGKLASFSFEFCLEPGFRFEDVAGDCLCCGAADAFVCRVGA